LIPEEMAWKILAQMILGLSNCHNRKEGKILHRDLKPGNVFIDG
jgi:NIMA (never in mitosis gene a)-related kinase